MNRWNQELEETRKKRREQIILAAEGLFLKNDIQNTTMMDIAKKAEISRATLYKYFKTIDELIIEVMIRFYQTLESEIMPVDDALSPVIKIRSGLENLCDFAGNHPEHYRFTVFFDNFYREDYHNEEVRMELKKLFLGKTWFEDTIREGQCLGQIKNELDPYETSRLLLNTIHAMLQKAVLRGNIISSMQKIDPLKQVRELIDILLEHIAI